MNPRDAVQETVRTLLDAMTEEKGLNIPEERKDSLSKEMANTDEFLIELENFMESYLEDYGDNYDLFDLFD